MSPLRPLSEGNRLQRWYAAWAAPYYARLPADAREAAELMDCFLYSRRGLGVWAGLLCAVIGSTVGLRHAGMPWALALFLSTIFWFVLPLSGLGAWLQPQRVLASARRRRTLALVLLLAALGALIGFTVGHVARRGTLDIAELGAALWRSMGVLAPAVLLVGLGLAALTWGVAKVRQSLLRQELERAALARETAEARLKLLQGQIQPHFIFNTLSALQHWVDTGDARAPALLRSLTAFLRGSTELLARDDTTLADEAAMVGHYLAIQQARLGARLQSSVEVAPALAATTLPPGLLLTLVENAVEHGVTPALGGGAVQVLARRDGAMARIEVVNTGASLAPGWRDGVGLANSRARLTHRWRDRASLSLEPRADGALATLLLPLQEGGAAP
jgi:Histidine kinase